MEAQRASEHASHDRAAAGSACFRPEDACKAEDASCEVIDRNQALNRPDTAAAPDALTLVNSSASTRCPQKGGLTHLLVSGGSMSSSATASPVQLPTTGTSLTAQQIHEKIASAAVAAANMKDLSKKKYCEHPGCMVQPTFNFPGERGGSHCGSHRLEGQINTVNKMCEVPGCFVRPSFKFPVRGAASQRCARHKLPGMVGNSGKSCLSECRAILEATTPVDECKTATPKRARGELLRIQREQMMQILGENGAASSAADDSEAKVDLPSPLSAPATSCKRMKYSLAAPIADDSELAILGGVSGEDLGSPSKGSAGQVSLQKTTVTPTTTAPSRDVATGKKADRAGGSLQFSPLLKAAADSGILNLKNSLTSQHSALHQLANQQGGPFAAAAAAASQRNFQPEMLPFDMSAPYGSFISSTDFNQALLALNFNASLSLWGLLPSANRVSTPVLPNFNPFPWAISDFLPTFGSAFHPSMSLNSAALSTSNYVSQLPQMLANLSADPSSHAAANSTLTTTTSETNNAPKNIDLS